MKKISFFIIIFIMCLLAPKVDAKTIKVMAVEKFSTSKPSSTFSVKTVETDELKDGIFVEKGSIISGLVVEIHTAQRGKRDSYFEFHPTSITYRGKTINISNSNIVAKVVGYKPVDPEKLAGNVAIKAANFVLLGSSQVISFTLGAAHAQNGERMKLGLDRMYKDSFVSFIEAGKELNIATGDMLLLKIERIH